jgi:hypothetical protein
LHHPNHLTSLLNHDRQNLAVQAAADKVFLSICLALEAETIQGQTSQRAVVAAKQLAQTSGINADALLSTLAPETQQTVRAFFA